MGMTAVGRVKNNLPFNKRMPHTVIIRNNISSVNINHFPIRMRIRKLIKILIEIVVVYCVERRNGNFFIY